MWVSIVAGFGQMLRPGVQWQTLAAFFPGRPKSGLCSGSIWRGAGSQEPMSAEVERE